MITFGHGESPPAVPAISPEGRRLLPDGVVRSRRRPGSGREMARKRAEEQPGAPG
ncbi:hypothetical protein [Streptosporangium sp. NPDC000396]|uniref:hypothetical protein n=1 Tax=Streptosporangium sp. NPDC000396 TaxID=3366185 RepID=UPI00367D07F2